MEFNIVKKILPKEDILVLLKMFDRESEPSLSSHIDLDKWSIKLENAVFIHCYLNGEIIGTLAYYIGEYIFITHIAVKSEYRRLHVAQKMLDSLLLTAKKDIKLIVRKDNVAAIKFYEKNHFQLSEEDNNEYVLIRKAEPSNVHQYEVCVHCPTYNHSLYIEDCLNGFIMQKTTFPFCVVIVDDASTDRNQEIIKHYAEKYPDIIQPVLLKENHYSIGKSRKEYYEEYDNKSKYIATCEGDDYWTDPLKLQKQVDFLESHPEYSMCFHKVNVILEEGVPQNTIESDFHDGEWSARDIYEKWIISTCSVVYRKFPVERDSRILFGDIFLFLQCAERGRMWCHNMQSATYRRHVSGASVSASIQDVMRMYEQYTFMKHRFPTLADISERKRQIYMNYLYNAAYAFGISKYRVIYIIHHLNKLFSKYLLRTIWYILKDLKNYVTKKCK